MRLPPSVRYLPSRLKFALNPWLWLGLLLMGIVGLAAWEYRQNPGQLPWQISSKSPRPTAGLSSSEVSRDDLTADEEAIAAELDNVELLLAQLESDVTDLTTGGEGSAAASLNSTADADGSSNESNVDRLNRYIDEYSFLGTGAKGANVQAITPIQKPRDSAFTFQQNPDDGQMVSALADALSQLEQKTLQSASSGPTTAANADADALDGPSLDGPSNNAAAPTVSDPPAFSFGQLDQSGVVPGSLEGLNRTFIRTTPNMSPPPGTTGYVPPASLSDFNRLNQPSTDSPFDTPSAPGALGGNTTNSPSRTQVLPPVERNNAATLDTPTFDNSSQATQEQPRNAWDNFWD